MIDENDEPADRQSIDSVIIVFAGTDQDAEVIKFAQNDLTEDRLAHRRHPPRGRRRRRGDDRHHDRPARDRVRPAHPGHRRAAERGGRRRQEAHAYSGPPGDPSMIKVLIVDDIPETRDHLSRLLGLEREIDVVGTASSGEEAIQVAMDMRPDIIVMDINMPGMDGMAASEIISQRLPHSPIIMMSVHGEAEHLKRAMLAGAREFLVKPFSGDEFATSIKRVHERELARREQMQATARCRRPRPPADGSAEDHQVIAVFSPKGGAGRTTLADEPGAGAQARDEPAGRAGRRQPPVRRRRRPAQPEPEEPLRPRRGRGRRAGSGHHRVGDGRSLDRDPRPARAAVPGGRGPRHRRRTCAR